MSSASSRSAPSTLPQHRDLMVPKPWRSVGAMAFDVACIASAMVLAHLVVHPAVWVAAIVVIGARQHGLLVLMHEAAHRGLFRGRRLNDRVGEALLAWPFFVTMASYRANHFAHHRELNGPDDPDWATYHGPDSLVADEWRFPRPAWRLALDVVFDLVGLGLIDQLRRMRRFTGGDKRPNAAPAFPSWVRWVFYAAGAVLLTWAGAWTSFLLLWVLPMLTVLKAALRVRLIAEHEGFDGGQGTRTTRVGPLGRFLWAPHHIAYHTEHHAFAAVRFWGLPELHRRLHAQLGAEWPAAAGALAGPTRVSKGLGAVWSECTASRPARSRAA